MIIFLEPIMKEKVWGGKRLMTEFPYHAEAEHVGECWAVSAHPQGDCVITAGEYAGKTLSWLYKEHRELFGNIQAEQFPLMVKIIDAQSDLSIQVHPDDAYAREHESVPFGKTESYYIMDCPENASLVIGHQARTRDELADMMARGEYEQLIRRVPVKKGDFLQVDSGVIHAIQSGFLVLETQQSSVINYRVYDYGRLVDGRPRQLHVQQSIDVINVPDESDKKALRHTDGLPENQLNLLVECTYYRIWKLSLKGSLAVEQEYPFLILSILEGSGMVDGHPMEKGAHLLFTSDHGTIMLEGEMELILSTV